MKKGNLQMGVLVVLILFAITIGPLWAGEAKLAESIGKGERVKACQISFAKAAQSKDFATNKGEPLTDINCPRGVFELKYDNIKGDDKKIDQDKLNVEIAKQIDQGWKFIASGKHFPWSSHNADDDHEYKSLCVTWATIEFDNELKKYLAKNKEKLEYELDSLGYTYPTKAQEKPYSEIIFGETPVLQARFKTTFDNRKVAIEDGGKIFSRVMVGDINNDWVFGWRGATKLLSNMGLDTDVSFFWQMWVLREGTSYSQFNEFNDGKEYRICDQIKN